MAAATLAFSAMGRTWRVGAGRFSAPALVPILVAVTLALSAATYARNNVWHDKITLWEDPVKKNPDNYRAQYNLGNSYLDADKIEKAMFHINESIRINPASALGYNKMGIAYLKAGRKDLAVKSFRMALSVEPSFPDALVNLGDTYLVSGVY